MDFVDVLAKAGATGGMVLLGLGLIEIIKRLLDRLPGLRANPGVSSTPISRKTPLPCPGEPYFAALESSAAQQTMLLTEIRDGVRAMVASQTASLTLLEIVERRTNGKG